MNNTDSNVRIENSSYKGSLLQTRKRASGEIFKEPFLDVLLTDVEQSSFSLVTPSLKKETQHRKGIVVKKQNKHQIRLVPEQQGNVTSSYPILRCPKVPVFTNVCKNFLSFEKFARSNNREGILVFVPDSWNGAIKTSNYLFALDKWITRDISLKSYIAFLFHLNANNTKTVQAVKRAKQLSFSDLLEKDQPISCLFKIGDYAHCGDKLGYLSSKEIAQRQALGGAISPMIIGESGKIVTISQTQVTIQKMQPVLFYSQAEIHVESNEWVKRGTPLLTLAHQTLVTGDIVQGIPRIEQLFEASSSTPPGAALQEFDFHPLDDFAMSRRGRNKIPVAETELKPNPEEGTANKESGIDTSLRLQHSSHLSSSNSYGKETGKQTVSKVNSNKNQIADSATHSNNTFLNENATSVANLSEIGENKFDSTVHSIREEKPLFLYQTLQSQVRETFRKKWKQLPLPVAVRQSLEEIQQIIVESIQKVYISQGVLIADKHIEIIVRQMTSKAQVFDGGSTGLLIDEILSLQQIENANISTPGQKAVYLPVIMGLTRAALSSDSFVSAASFQETTRVLSRDAIAGKTDFLRGLKEKVIIGDLIDAGTGLDAFYIYSLFSKKLFENKFREILNRKVTHKTLKKLVLTVSRP